MEKTNDHPLIETTGPNFFALLPPAADEKLPPGAILNDDGHFEWQFTAGVVHAVPARLADQLILDGMARVAA